MEEYFNMFVLFLKAIIASCFYRMDTTLLLMEMDVQEDFRILHPGSFWISKVAAHILSNHYN